MSIEVSLKKPLLTLFLVVATELIGFGLIIPILPQLASQFAVKPIYIGLLMASYSLAQFIAAPILGGLSDTYGRKPILIVSKIGSCAGYIMLAFSHSYVWFLAARLLDGFSGGNISAARAYVADVTTPENRPKGMAVIGIAFGTGFILGPALGGFFYGLGKGHTPAALVAAGLSFIALLFTIFLLKEPPNRSKGERRSWAAFVSVLNMPAIRYLFLIQLAYMIVFAGFETTFSVFTHHTFGFDPKQNSLLFMYSGILGLLVQGFISRKSSKSIAGMVVTGFVVTAISFALLSQLTSFYGLLATLAVFSIGIGIVNTYLPSLVSVTVKGNNEGKSMGVYESIGSMGRILGPAIAYLTIFSSLEQLYLVYAVVLALGAMSFLWFKKV